MKIVSDAPGMRELQVNGGKIVKRDRSGQFQVPDQLGKSFIKTGEFTVVGTTLREAQGFKCANCGFVAVFKDHCGRCDGTDLAPE